VARENRNAIATRAGAVGCEAPRLWEGGKWSIPADIPAPIKKPYIWDLTSEASSVLACLNARLRVYILAWGEIPPDGPELENTQMVLIGLAQLR